MTKIINAIMAILLSLGLLLVGVQHVQVKKARNQAVEATKKEQATRRSLESLEAVHAASEADHKNLVAVLESRARTAEALTIRVKKEHDDLRQALAEHPDWASQPIPDSVRSAIQGGPGVRAGQ